MIFEILKRLDSLEKRLEELEIKVDKIINEGITIESLDCGFYD